MSKPEIRTQSWWKEVKCLFNRLFTYLVHFTPLSVKNCIIGDFVHVDLSRIAAENYVQQSLRIHTTVCSTKELSVLLK